MQVKKTAWRKRQRKRSRSKTEDGKSEWIYLSSQDRRKKKYSTSECSVRGQESDKQRRMAFTPSACLSCLSVLYRPNSPSQIIIHHFHHLRDSAHPSFSNSPTFSVPTLFLLFKILSNCFENKRRRRRRNSCIPSSSPSVSSL